MYPTYATMHAIHAVKHGKLAREKMQMQWLTYWVMYNLAHLLDSIWILRMQQW